MSTSDAVDPAELIPVPTFLFQGSIALGSICEQVLGPAMDGKQLVHPLLIAGWCGLFTQARPPLPLLCLLATPFSAPCPLLISRASPTRVRMPLCSYNAPRRWRISRPLST